MTVKRMIRQAIKYFMDKFKMLLKLNDNLLLQEQIDDALLSLKAQAEISKKIRNSGCLRIP